MENSLFESVDEYIDSLSQQGFYIRDDRLTGHSRKKLQHYIPAIGQARFHDYTYPFLPALRNNKTVGIDHVLRLYRFDRKLRLLTLDATERVEVALKSVLAAQLSTLYGEKWHTDRRFRSSIGRKLNADLKIDVGRSPLMRSLEKEGKGYDDLPSSRVLENVSFGRVEKLLNTLPKGSPRTDVARRFDLTTRVFQSWVSTTRNIRNTAAHHSRLWNRQLRAQAVIPLEIRKEIGDVEPNYHQRFYGAAVILKAFSSNMTRNSQWRVRLRRLVEENNIGHLDIKKIMGFPDDWWETEFWK